MSIEITRIFDFAYYQLDKYNLLHIINLINTTLQNLWSQKPMANG